jgi:hypothetical protein
MFYCLWIPAITIIMIACGYFTVWANSSDGFESWKWVGALYVLNFLGLWPLIAKFSKNLVLDALLYDLIIFFAFYLTMLHLKAADHFTMTQWVGTIVVLAGFVMIKVGAYW